MRIQNQKLANYYCSVAKPSKRRPILDSNPTNNDLGIVALHTNHQSTRISQRTTAPSRAWSGWLLRAGTPPTRDTAQRSP
ncbi:MAG: hypothetical protein ACOC44_14905 [Promethearchaeia archaeon]